MANPILNYDLLKLQGLVESGAAAKTLIAQGEVKVDGKVETRKRCKISKIILSL